MQHWGWIGNYTIVRTGSHAGAMVNGSVTFDPQMCMWKWLVMADNVKVREGMTVTARMAVQQVDTYFEEEV